MKKSKKETMALPREKRPKIGRVTLDVLDDLASYVVVPILRAETLRRERAELAIPVVLPNC